MSLPGLGPIAKNSHQPWKDAEKTKKRALDESKALSEIKLNCSANPTDDDAGQLRLR
jgi:hypothetical protein